MLKGEKLWNLSLLFLSFHLHSSSTMKFSIDQLLRGSFVPRTARYLEYLQLAPNMLGKLGGKNAATARMCVRARRTKRAKCPFLGWKMKA